MMKLQHDLARTLICLFSGLLMIVAAPSHAAQEDLEIPFEGTAPAPDFPADVSWLNTDHPLDLKDLRGKVVLLDFWTYCCINCMHIIPDLKKLEAKYDRELVVIGVHSAKFDNEKDTANIRRAILRYEIRHPVINDSDFEVWRAYGARAWPTLVLINPEGRIIGQSSGEGVYKPFDRIIGATVRHFDALGKIDRRPLHFSLEAASEPHAFLSFPGKITTDQAGDRLFFTDSNHNRIIVAAPDGRVREIIGDGQEGLRDGTFAKARFFRPQGLCFDPRQNVLYIADTENHAIRQVDLERRVVTTLAGDGHQGKSRQPRGAGKDVELNSPWDLVRVGDTLYIAMAGSHQIWQLDLKSRQVSLFAGSGRENIMDGPRATAALAQPSGLATDGERLFVADSEVSAIREVGLSSTGRVETVIGEGLFEFGDVDGKYPKARLQHCIGVAFHDGLLYVADTYNHKIKRLNPRTRELETLIGTGKSGKANGPARQAELNEPNGLCFARGKMFIADSNNHLIRVYDPKSGLVSTLNLSSPTTPHASAN